MINAYFSRPGTNCDIKKVLINDIKNAKTQILLAVAYFNDPEISEQIKKCKVNDKRFIFNNADLNRKSDKRPVEIYQELGNEFNSVVLGTHYFNEIPNYMHHKFIIIDDILWMGSYNFTEQANKRNWESMIRVKEDILVKEFTNEFEKMWLIGSAVKQKLKYDYCTECNQKVDDPMTHFGIMLNTCSFFSGLDDEYTYYVICNGKGKIKDKPIICDYCGETISQSQTITLDDSSSCYVICHNCFGDYINKTIKERNQED